MTAPHKSEFPSWDRASRNHFSITLIFHLLQFPRVCMSAARCLHVCANGTDLGVQLLPLCLKFFSGNHYSSASVYHFSASSFYYYSFSFSFTFIERDYTLAFRKLERLWMMMIVEMSTLTLLIFFYFFFIFREKSKDL